MVNFTPERSDTIRANLIHHVAENPPQRRRRALWATGFVLAGALAGAGASAGAFAASGRLPVPDADAYARVPDYGPTADHFLEVKSTAAEPKDPHGTLDLLGLRSEELQQYEDFGGLSLWSGESRNGTECLLVAHPGQGLLEGIGDARCAPDGLDTIADIVLCSGCSTPPGLFDGLPTGSLVRFVLRDDHVEVYMYVRASVLEASSS
ncbi:hypothetical protein LG299_13085 [Microbacterium lacus]|uniref:hypothetical protein n=1 Tax=Microbacterium lacus TaxID=415217 RepID=UPI00384D3CEB